MVIKFKIINDLIAIIQYATQSSKAGYSKFFSGVIYDATGRFSVDMSLKILLESKKSAEIFK